MATRKSIPIRLPKPVADIRRWLVVALDPSLTRTGYALMTISRLGEATVSKWIDVGSIGPDDSSQPQWVRARAISKAVFDKLFAHVHDIPRQHQGLLIAVEHPTPREDRLVSLNRILHSTLLTDAVTEEFGEVRILSLNASTLRSMMGLTQRGAKNKKENVAKAYTFLDEKAYPNLDTDACDAVLIGTIARHTVSLLHGLIDEVPPAIMARLCDSTDKTKGKGRNARLVTEGVLHRSEYWYAYAPTECSVSVRDAQAKKRVLERKVFTI